MNYGGEINGFCCWTMTSREISAKVLECTIQRTQHQQQPTVLGLVNGEHRIVSGHRRNLANIMNIEKGHVQCKRIRYLYKEMTGAEFELFLLIGNAYNRELTAWEKTLQTQKLKETLLKAKREDGLKIPGKLRDLAANLMNESSTNIAGVDAIQKNNRKCPIRAPEFFCNKY